MFQILLKTINPWIQETKYLTSIKNMKGKTTKYITIKKLKISNKEKICMPEKKKDTLCRWKKENKDDSEPLIINNISKKTVEQYL